LGIIHLDFETALAGLLQVKAELKGETASKKKLDQKKRRTKKR
jgi:hypothetical protein